MNGKKDEMMPKNVDFVGLNEKMKNEKMNEEMSIKCR